MSAPFNENEMGMKRLVEDEPAGARPRDARRASRFVHCGSGGRGEAGCRRRSDAGPGAPGAEGREGKEFWRSIDELAGTPEFEEAVKQEFPAAAQEWVDPVSRRGFMKLMGASMALAGLAGCTKQPDEPIYPYVKQPEDLILGKPNFFATAYPFRDWRNSDAGEERRVPAHQSGRKSGAQIQPGRKRRFYPGLAAGPLRSRPLVEGAVPG